VSINPRLLYQKTVDHLTVKVFSDRVALGNAATKTVVAWMQKAIARKDTVNTVFASAPSQNEFLTALTTTQICTGHGSSNAQGRQRRSSEM
jgi:hypothetical protein